MPWGCNNILPQTGAYNHRNVLSHTPEARNLKSGVGGTRLPLEASGAAPSCLLQLVVACWKFWGFFGLWTHHPSPRLLHHVGSPCLCSVPISLFL